MEVTHDVSKKSACHKSWIRKKNPGKECNGLSMLPPQFLYCEQPLKSRQTYLTIFLAVLRQRLIGTKRCAYANFNSVWNSDNNVTSHIESCVNKRRAMTVTVKNLEENIFRSLSSWEFKFNSLWNILRRDTVRHLAELNQWSECCEVRFGSGDPRKQ